MGMPRTRKIGTPSRKFESLQKYNPAMNAANELSAIFEEYIPALNQLQEPEASEKPSPSKWSKKECIGHLIDSAHNNIRRFIVAQYEDNPVINYRQDDWVRINHYQEQPLINLIRLWCL